jgi:hypothetical protein
MRIHSGGDLLQTNFSCVTCSKEFASKNVLGKHLKLAHPPAVTPFQCAVCDKKFPKKRGLLQHMKRVHSGGPFACAKCDETFKSATLYIYSAKFPTKI